MVSKKKRRNYLKKYKEISMNKTLHNNRVLRINNFKADIKCFDIWIHRKPKPIPNGEQKLIRIEKCDLFRKISKHRIVQLYRFDVKTNKMFKDFNIEDKGVRISSNKICRKLLLKRIVNRDKGKPEYAIL